MRNYRIHALVAAAYLGTFLSTLDISIVNVALPTMQTALNADLSGLQWVVNIYAIALSAVMLSAGPLSDRYGHKKVWLGGVLLFVLGSIVCSLASRLNFLLEGRAIQGVAGALLIPGAMPILAHAFPDQEKRARAIGGWAAFSALSLIAGPLAGGLLVEHMGWQSIFLVNVPLGMAAALLGAWGIPERKHPEHAAFDPFGQVLSMIWLGMLSYGLIEIGGHSDALHQVLVPLMIAAISFIAFVWVERHVQRPLFPVRLFRNRPFALTNVASFVLGFSSYSSLFFLSLFLQQARGSTPALTGRQLMPQFVVMALTSLFFGHLTRWFCIKHLIVSGYLLMGLALCAMVFFSPATPYVLIGASLSLLGLGTGLSVPAAGMIVMGCVAPERAGVASALMNALRQTGMTLGIATLGSVMSINAVNKLALTAHDAGLDDPARTAHSAIVDHIFLINQEWFIYLYRSAMASGFALAMACAGALSLAMAALLFFFFRKVPLGEKPQ